jgi:hypothetical protein
MINTRNNLRLALAVALGVLALFVGLSLLPNSEPVEAAPAQETTYQATYTTTGYADATYVALYDKVNIHAHVVVSGGAGTTTVVLQQSGQSGVNCASATNWYTSTEYKIMESEAATDTLITLEDVHDFTISGDGDAARAFDVTGRCARIKIYSTAGTYTPTLYMRVYQD